MRGSWPSSPQTRSATILLATPTFLRGYLRRCEPEELETLEIVVAGAEKLPIALCEAFEQKFGVRPVEGYGTTELSPLVSVNVPPSRSQERRRRLQGRLGRPAGAGRLGEDRRPGNVRRPLPLGTPGMLLVKGPNVMKGYLGQPEETAKVMRDGWYITGDIAMIDTRRLHPHHGPAEPLLENRRRDGAARPHRGSDPEDPRRRRRRRAEASSSRRCPTSARANGSSSSTRSSTCRPKKSATSSPRRACPTSGFPAPTASCEVEAIPVLGSGKTDLKAVADLAKRHFGAAA